MRTTSVVGVAKPISRLALGTMIVNIAERERSFRLLDDALAAGITVLDSAWVYAGGDSERCIGEWMRARGNRERVVVLTKGGIANQDRNRITAYDIEADLRDSLVRLKTDYVDIYLLHRDDPAVPVGEIVDILDSHRRAGRIRAFGGSNWTHLRIAAANAYAASKGIVGFTASSPNFGLAEQVDDPWGPGCTTIAGPRHTDARSWYRAAHMPVFAYSSLARGLFSGRISRANFAETQSQLDHACRTAYCHEVNFKRLDRLHQLAAERGCTVPQLATAWIMHQDLDVVAIVGAANAEEIRTTVAALDIALSEDDSAWLDLGGARKSLSGNG